MVDDGTRPARRWTTLDEAAASVPDGAVIAPGGFMIGRAPMALVFELVRQRRRNLHVISLPNPLPAEISSNFGAYVTDAKCRSAITRMAQRATETHVPRSSMGPRENSSSYCTTRHPSSSGSSDSS